MVNPLRSGCNAAICRRGSGDARMKVSFLGVGSQKAGTSALDAYLRTHPGLCMAKVKEVHLFDDDQTFFKRTLGGYAAYHRQFAPTSSTQLIGEITPAYMYWNEAPRRIWDYNPAMKLIAVLRNPITRAFSQWNMQRDVGIDPLPFWDAMQAEAERCRASLPYQNRKFSYVDRGFYTGQVRRLWSFFPAEQVLVLRYDDLRRDPEEHGRPRIRFPRCRAAPAAAAAGRPCPPVCGADVAARVGVPARRVRIRDSRARAHAPLGLRRMASPACDLENDA